MHVDEALIDKLASLARLRFGAAEKESLRGDLERMISLVEKLNEVDTRDVEPLLYVSSQVNVLRPDEALHTITRDEALRNAADHDDQFFLVPQAIKK